VALTFHEVAEILKVIDASQCDELVLELEGARLVIRRHGSGAAVEELSGAEASRAAAPVPPVVAAGAPDAVGRPEPEAAPAIHVEAPSVARGDNSIEVCAPMVGTFYRAPSPKDPPFVDVGSSVAAGDPLCLIEVMKLFTTIEAPVSGEVVEIAAANASLVEFGQLLFAIRPQMAGG